ncbi:MAG: thiamine biosynthesis protein [Desulfobulbaceae bacterium]|uniref:Thiamine biosynthesis protein n=1 Tax=Candidatus Desulfatifera sulfidica TaxID=2841691 RepID=A0A8J6NB35_9BACT|nr:thiamine biosynthesis protein [Candidatus Desulfatifera sulfidica]
MSQVTAISLFSGGLDSILATRMVMSQGIRVVAIKFVTPFFDDRLLENTSAYQDEIRKKYNIEVVLVDLSSVYLDLLHAPQHGFGKNFNPCIDCKILMLSRAREMMATYQASFIVTGEVLGQRPMSQRRDTLRVIARDSQVESLLLRPLSAKLLPESEAERAGWVDREQMGDFTGRGRSRQIALAREYGITDFPSPAGGCILADPILSHRIARIYAGEFVITPGEITLTDIRLLLVGRQFVLPDFPPAGTWLILGRDEGENDRLENMAEAGDALLFMPDWPGPTVLIRRAERVAKDAGLDELLQLAASLVVRYAKKGTIPPEVTFEVRLDGRVFPMPVPSALNDDLRKEWQLV